jgi:sugar lactone lactonase YvrE
MPRVVRESTAELFVAAGADLAEGPAWNQSAGCLVWVDILGCKVHLTEADGSARATFSFDRHVGAALPAADGTYLVVLRDGFVTLDPAGGAVTPLLDVLTDRPDLRFNDAKADPRGRAFAGTMPYESGTGALYRLDAGPTAAQVFGPTELSNGLGWSPDGRTMYFIDTPADTVHAFDYDLDTGKLGSPRTLVEVHHPDGMCVDDDGCLWVALYGGSAVHRYTPDGRLDAVIHLPVTNVTCCAFGPGGRLYITTADNGLSPEEKAKQPLAGSLFVADPGVTGPFATPWQPV